MSAIEASVPRENSSGRSYITGEVYWYIDRRPDYSLLNILNDTTHSNALIKKQYIDIVCNKIEINEEDVNCCICMETREKESICSFNCQHTFCALCIKDILKTLKNICCPLCRATIENITTQIKSIQEELIKTHFT